MAKSTRARPAPAKAASRPRPARETQPSLLDQAPERPAARRSGALRAEQGAAEEEAGFGGPQVCALVDISYRQLDYWARTGLLKPSIAAARGSGTKRRYSYRDLVQLKVIKQLLDAGISLRSARRAIDCLRSHLGEDLAASKLVLTGNSAVLVGSDGDVVDLLAGGQGVFNIVPMAGVVAALDADIVRLAGRPAPSATAKPGRRETTASGGSRRAARR